MSSSSAESFRNSFKSALRARIEWRSFIHHHEFFDDDDESILRRAIVGSVENNRTTTTKKKKNKTTTTRHVTKCQTSQTASFSPKGAKISGVGKALPKKFITNDDLAKLVETNDEWIRTRTGIGKRHVISGDETLTSLAEEASLEALKMANVNPEDIDLIIVATSSPDDLFGSACLLQSAIGAKGALAYDLTAACSGFVVG